MTKLNFDLKLEIFHRTQQMTALEKKVQRMQEMEEELHRLSKVEEEVFELRDCQKRNRDLEAANHKLHQELSMKDKAVSEAVEWICKLEAENDELKMNSRSSHPSMNRLVLDGPNASPRGRATIDIPERTSSRRGVSLKSPSRPGTGDSRQLSMAPSFLRSDNRSTATLRSLYAPDINKSHSALSQLTKTESFHSMNEVIEPESPRLSVLSECSELNPYDTPSKQSDFDKLKIPIRKAPSITDSVVSSVAPSEHECKDAQINRWMQAPADPSDTVVRRRDHRSMSDASKHDLPALIGALYSSKPLGRPWLDSSLFGGAKLPPTPDTMSTTYATAKNGSNGSIAADKSPKAGRNEWFSGRHVERRRSADEVTTLRSFNGSDVVNSMQTNCSDTPRIGSSSHSPTFFPFNTVAPKASVLLGPGSPSNPSLDPFTDVRKESSDDYELNITPVQSPTRIVTAQPQLDCDSPPLTPQDWIAAAKQGPRSRRNPGLRIEAQSSEPHRNVLSQAAFHDDETADSWSLEAEVPGVPTLDMATLDMLEQAMPDLAPVPEAEDEPAPEQRRRLSFRPPFFGRSSQGPRRQQSSPVIADFADEEDDGAPSPIIPKTRNAAGRRRPVSQIITSSNDLCSSSLPAATDRFDSHFEPFNGSKSLQQSFMDARETSVPTHSATMAARPTTSHSGDRKRRSSLGIFGWVKGVGGKRSEPTTPVVADKFSESIHQDLRGHHLQHENSFSTVRAATPDSMHSPGGARSRPEISCLQDDPSRRPRYMGRRSRRLQ